MARFRKIPIVVEAIPYEPEKKLEDGNEELTLKEAEALKIDHVLKDWYSAAIEGSEGRFSIPYIQTPEGKHYIAPDDMIVMDAIGERHPMKKVIFIALFEPAPGAAMAGELVAARCKLEELEREYAAIGRFIPPLKALIGGLRERFDAGESTQQLYEEIMAARISA